MRLLTVREVATQLGVSTNCVYQLVARGDIPHVRAGVQCGVIRIRDIAVDQYLNSRETTGTRQEVRVPVRAKLKHIKF